MVAILLMDFWSCLARGMGFQPMHKATVDSERFRGDFFQGGLGFGMIFLLSWGYLPQTRDLPPAKGWNSCRGSRDGSLEKVLEVA